MTINPISAPVCNPSVAACAVANPVYYAGGAFPPVADTYQPVAVPPALTDDPTRFPSFFLPLFPKEDTLANAHPIFSDPSRGAEDLLADGAVLLNQEAEDKWNNFQGGGTVMVAGGFLVTSAEPICRAATTIGPAVGLYYASDWEAGRLMDSMGLSEDLQRGVRPILTTGLTVANYWAFTEIGSRLQSRWPTLPGVARPDWAQFRQAAPGLLVASHLAGQAAHFTGIDGLRNGTIGNTVVRIGAPALAYRYGPAVAARFPLLGGALRLTPARVAGRALAMVAAADFGASIGESLRVALRCSSDECQLNEAVFNTVYGEEIDDSWFPGLARKWIQIKTHFTDDFDEKGGEIWSSWLEAAGKTFPDAVDQALVELALNSLQPDGDRMTLDWAAFENGLKEFYTASQMDGVYQVMDLIEDKGGDTSDLIYRGLTLKGIIARDGALLSRSEMQDYLENRLFRRQKIGTSVVSLLEQKQSQFYQRYVELGLGVGVSLDKTSRGVGIHLKTPQGERFVPLESRGDEITLGNPYSFVRKGELGDLAILTRTREDGAVEIALQSKTSPAMVTIEAAWNEGENNYTMIMRTIDGEGHPVTADTVTHTGRLLMPIPVPRDRMTKVQQEFLRGVPMDDGGIALPEVAIRKSEIEFFRAIQQKIDSGDSLTDLINFGQI